MDDNVIRHARRRWCGRGQERDERRAAKIRRRLRRGQTLVIFALSFTVLVALAGLSIDAARAFDTYARMQRAAEAGALAGVLYMPTFYSQPTPAGIGTSQESAVSRASEEIVKNGFGTVLPNNISGCPPTGYSSEMAICQVSGRSDELQVTITETLSVVLLSGLGVQPITLTATAHAEYLPSVQLGSRLNYFGDQVECYNSVSSPSPTQTHHCNRASGSGHLQNFLATIDGPQTLKEDGDPMVYCEEGPTSSSGPDGSNTSAYTTYNGVNTNHQQWANTRAGVQPHCGLPGGGNPGNTDQQLPGYSGPATGTSTAHPGGYNYEIVVPQGITAATVWVYNPTFIPGDDLRDPSGDGNSPPDYIYPYGTDPFGAGVTFNGRHADAPPFYFTVTYSIYHVQSLYDRTADVLMRSEVFAPYDGYSSDISYHSCSGTNPAYDPYYAGATTANSYYNSGSIVAGGGCVDLANNTVPAWNTNPNAGPPCYLMWCQITTSGLGAGIYRLVVEVTGLSVPQSLGLPYYSSALNGAGPHSYALKVCASAVSSPISCPDGSGGGQSGVTLFGWNNIELDVASPLSSTSYNANNPATTCASSGITDAYTCVDLGCIPTPYAGRTVDARLFDPGDGSGNIYVGIVPPAGVPQSDVQYTQSWVTTQTIDNDQVVQAGHGSYNALNGLWLDAILTLPSTYTGNCQTGSSGTGWWQLIYTTDNGATPRDWLNVQFSLVGSPVHLVN